MKHLFDTHFHLDLQKDRNSAIKEIEENGIYTIAVTNLPDLYRRERYEIASKYIRFALGFHPELIGKYKDQIQLMWDLLPTAKYIGEVGLDFSDTTFKLEQDFFFEKLIDKCADDEHKIITIHSRRSASKVIDLIGTGFKFKPILHWFTGNKSELIAAVNAGFYFSLNIAMMRSAKFLKLLPLIPHDKILLETDSPFIYNYGSHNEMLNSTINSLREKRNDVDVWGNFYNILLSTK